MYGLQERNVMACMCGVVAHESAHRFWPIHEFGTDFSRYGYAPSGQDYGGRGLIQTTWASNYKQAQDVILARTGQTYDLVNNPDLILNDPVLAAHCACVYFVERSDTLVAAARRLDYGEVIHYVWGLNQPGNPSFDQYYAEVKYAAEYLLAR
jgi:predicted chitinase